MRMLAGIPVAKKLHNYTVTPVTTSAWVEIISATDTPSSAIEIFSGSGAPIKLSTGAAGSEDSSELPYYIIPGGSSIMLPLNLAKGARISAKAMVQDADAGVMVLNLFG